MVWCQSLKVVDTFTVSDKWVLNVNWSLLPKERWWILFSVNKWFLLMVFKIFLFDLTKSSQTATIQRQIRLLNFRWICCFLKVLAVLFWPIQVCASWSYFSTQVKEELLFNFNIFTWHIANINSNYIRSKL